MVPRFLACAGGGIYSSNAPTGAREYFVLRPAASVKSVQVFGFRCSPVGTLEPFSCAKARQMHNSKHDRGGKSLDRRSRRYGRRTARLARSPALSGATLRPDAVARRPGPPAQHGAVAEPAPRPCHLRPAATALRRAPRARSRQRRARLLPARSALPVPALRLSPPGPGGARRRAAVSAAALSRAATTTCRQASIAAAIRATTCARSTGRPTAGSASARRVSTTPASSSSSAARPTSCGAWRSRRWSTPCAASAAAHPRPRLWHRPLPVPAPPRPAARAALRARHERPLPEAARELLAGTDTSLIADNAEAIPFADAQFDAVTSVFLFHELPSDTRRRVMREAWRVLAPGGRFVVCDSAQLADSRELEPALRPILAAYHEPYYKWLSARRPRQP